VSNILTVTLSAGLQTKNPSNRNSYTEWSTRILCPHWLHQSRGAWFQHRYIPFL